MVWGWVSLCYIDLLWPTTWPHITHSMRDYLNLLLAICRATPLSSKEGREDNMSGVIIGITSDLF